MEQLISWFVGLEWWVHVLFGMTLWFAIQNFVIPDTQSIWLAKRENGLMAFMPFAVLALVVGFVNLVVWLWKSVDFVWIPISIAPWLWLLVAFGLIVVIAFFVSRRVRHP